MVQPSTQQPCNIPEEPTTCTHLHPPSAGVNFALFAQHAKHVTLCLYDEDTDCVTEYPLDPGSQRSGDVWHISLEGLPGSGVMYGFKVAGDGGWDTGHRCVHGWRSCHGAAGAARGAWFLCVRHAARVQQCAAGGAGSCPLHGMCLAAAEGVPLCMDCWQAIRRGLFLLLQASKAIRVCLVMLSVMHALCRRWYPNNILLDPYAPLVAGRHKWATRDELEKFKKNVRRCCSLAAWWLVAACLCGVRGAVWASSMVCFLELPCTLMGKCTRLLRSRNQQLCG